MQQQGLYPSPSGNKLPRPIAFIKESSFSVDSRCPEIPQSLVLEPTNQATNTLIESWRSGSTTRGDTELAMNCGYRGFQITSRNCAGRPYLEGIALYARKRYGMYLRALETAPWNRINRKFSGIASVLVARLAQESDRNGCGGIIFAIPSNFAAEKFNMKIGFVYFRQYASKHNLARDDFPLGYEYSMVLDSSDAKKLVADQLERKGDLNLESSLAS